MKQLDYIQSWKQSFMPISDRTRTALGFFAAVLVVSQSLKHGCLSMLKKGDNTNLRKFIFALDLRNK